ncbi:LIPS lipase, partial [Pycnonotus jocosus]|nr:LIPS lipase [Pycnonotus jocosus]
AALGQLRALLVLAGKMAEMAKPGRLFPDGGEEEEEEEQGKEEGISEVVLREYSTMHNGCFYGRCLGFQVRISGIWGDFWELLGFGGFFGIFWS